MAGMENNRGISPLAAVAPNYIEFMRSLPTMEELASRWALPARLLIDAPSNYGAAKATHRFALVQLRDDTELE
jgi:hypothetical protein